MESALDGCALLSSFYHHECTLLRALAGHSKNIIFLFFVEGSYLLGLEAAVSYFRPVLTYLVFLFVCFFLSFTEKNNNNNPLAKAEKMCVALHFKLVM